MKRGITMIKVETLPNGYSLEFDGMSKKGGYMYFSPEKLLKGFMLHIGLEMTDQLNTETMDDFIVAACNWNDNKKCLKEIERLKHSLRIMTGKRAAIAKQLVAERNRHIVITDDVNSLISEMKDYPDKYLRERVKKIMNNKIKLIPLSLEKLGVKYSDFLDEDSENENKDEL